MFKSILLNSILFYALMLILSSVHAQVVDPQIILVPYNVSYENNPSKLSIAHPAHSNARITLKGILRNTNCASGYQVIWDSNRDSVFNGNDINRVVYPSLNTVYDIGATFQVPNVANDTLMLIDVAVTNLCTQQTAYDSFPLYVRAWTPSPNPTLWTDEQREIMVQMAIQEGLWYIHRNIKRSGTNSQMTGYISINDSYYSEGSMTSLWAMNINGHLPAYPPNQINAYQMQISQDWHTKNNIRWQRDPYAETTIRLINYVLSNGTNLVGINPVDESNLCKIANGVEVACHRLPNTTDGRGAYTNGVSNNVYNHGLHTGAMSTVLTGLAGTPLQVSALAGVSWEYFIQQMVDLLGYMQIDGGCGLGGWNYTATDGAADCNSAFGSLSQWAYVGLETAEYAGKDFGVIVANRHKYRIPNHLKQNMGPQGGSSYTSWYANQPDQWEGSKDNLQLTGGALLAARWTGINKMSLNDNSRPFLSYSNYTAGQLRSIHDTILNFITSHWNDTAYGWLGSNRFWSNGNYLCGNQNSVYNWGNEAHCGNLYGFYCHQKGYRALSTENDTAQGLVGTQNWQKQFETYMIRSQYRNLGDYGSFGLITDCPLGQSTLCFYGNHNITAGVGVLILTPTIFKPKPVAIAQPKQVTVLEGCYQYQDPSSSNGFVELRHDQSFHPNPNARIELFQWDAGDDPNVGSGRWWDLIATQPNITKDFEKPYQYTDLQGVTLYGLNQTFKYRYLKRGSYVAQLRVVESTANPTPGGARILGQSQTDNVTVSVLAAPNVAPVANHGGPYELEVGDPLVLKGLVSDANQACGDLLTVGWELDGNENAFNDFIGATGTIPSTSLARFQPSIPYTIRLRAIDSGTAGINRLSNEVATQLTIYPKNPIALATATSTSLSCQQQVTFDASLSKHPNPKRTIVRYEWDVDGVDGFDGNGVSFTYAYQKYGTYRIKLRVTDDLGRYSEYSEIQVNVNQGNAAPVPRIAQRDYTVLEGQALSLNASASYDSNRTCGDQIVRYEWDLNGNGIFSALEGDITADDPRSLESTLQLSWLELSSRLLWPADHLSLEPSNTIYLRVTDLFGLSAINSTKVVIFRADPIAYFDQTPNPASIDQATGKVQVTLDARESYSPIPGGSIIAYRWDLNHDGIFGDSTQSVVQFLRIYQNLDPLNVPAPVVALEVTDHRGAKSIISKTLRFGLGDVPPTADADPSDAPEIGYHILLGDDLTLNATQSIEPNKDDYIAHYRWYLSQDIDPVLNQVQIPWTLELQDQDRDGSEAITVVTYQQLMNLGVATLGTYELLLEIQDSTLLSARDRSKLTIHPVNPIAVAQVDPLQAACPQRITLDASASYHSHPQIKIVEWQWDMNGNQQFNDPEDLSGQKISYLTSQYTFNGPMNITLKVTDSRGNSDIEQVSLNINQSNSSPIAQTNGPYAFAINDQSIVLSGTQSSDPDQQCADQITRYEWDIKQNNTIDATTPSFMLTRDELFNRLGLPATGTIGKYSVKLSVWDRFNQIGSSVVDLDIVNGPTAVAQVSPNRVSCQSPMIFDGSTSFTDGPVNQGFALSKYEWDFNRDGIFEVEGKSVTRNAIGDGIYQATLRVTDVSQRTSVSTISYEIANQNLPPIANAGGPYTAGKINNQWIGVDLDAQASTDPNAPCDRITTYLWDTDADGLFGRFDTNGANGSARDLEGALIQGYVNSNWRVGQSQIVSVIACDDDQALSCSSQPAQSSITVTDKTPPAIELLSPRVTQCVSTQISQIQARVKDFDGGTIVIKAIIDNQVVAQTQVNSIAGGTWVNFNMDLDSAQFPEGSKLLTIKAIDPTNLESLSSSGGAVLFDRTAPQVSISQNLLANVCYPINQIPTYQITAEDNIDSTPTITQETLSQYCERTLVVNATDRCGNRSTVRRIYRVGQPISLELTGALDGSLVANTRFNWNLNVPVACVSAVTAELMKDSSSRFVYGANTLIDVAGNYTFKLDVANCEGTVQTTRRNFRVNAAPTAIAIPDGHPNGNLDSRIASYVVSEGQVLRLDALSSLAPETQDLITAYRWDLYSNQIIDSTSALYPFDTSEDGFFEGVLEVEDSFGLKNTAPFEVLVQDVHPILQLSGTYQGVQGQPLVFNATQSRASHSSDPLSQIEWFWGDQSPDTMGRFDQLSQTSHLYDQHGQYEARVVLRDEDSSVQQNIQVSIRDVNPVIAGVNVNPVNMAYELQNVLFQVSAQSLASADPIVSYDFDFLGNGIFKEYPQNQVMYQYENAGSYTVKIRVRDIDSATVVTLPFEVREVSFIDLLREIDALSARILADPSTTARVRAFLAPEQQLSVSTLVKRGIWNQEQRELAQIDRMKSLYQGNTLMILDELLFRLNRIQNEGVTLNGLLWKLSRQLLREEKRFAEQQLASQGALLMDAYYIRASQKLEIAEQIFHNIDFKDRVSQRDGYLARDLYAILFDVHFSLRQISDLSHIYEEFPLPHYPDLANVLFHANDVNTEIVASLNQLQDELTSLGIQLSQSPEQVYGIDEINAVIAMITPLKDLVGQKVGLTCPSGLENDPACQFISDRDSLSLELSLMDLVVKLFSLSQDGIYVLNAQTMLTLAVKFRVEIDLIRVENVCGIFNPYPMAARAQQNIMLQLLAQGQNDAAMLFYISPERRCLAIEQYNQCVLPALNRRRSIEEQEDPYPTPERCEALRLSSTSQQVVSRVTPPIPLRAPFTDIGLLYDIIRSFNFDWQLSQPNVLTQHLPQRTWAMVNRYDIDFTFDLNDVNHAILSFNHDIVDADGDGLKGIVELECQLRNRVFLSPTNPSTFGKADGEIDCDGDLIPNAQEVSLVLNPTDARDALMDIDMDGVNNLLEWQWRQKGLALDIRDPSDVLLDHDMDGLISRLEILGLLDPTNPNDGLADFDLDGLSNAVELKNGLNPRDRTDADLDIDMDGLSSRLEIQRNRNPLVADCVNDAVELSGRDDLAENARVLVFVQENDQVNAPKRATFDRGLICRSGLNADEDWYRFELTQGQDRVALRITDMSGGLSLRLYDSHMVNIAQSDTAMGDESIFLSRGQLTPGQYFIKISHKQGNQAPETAYLLQTTIISSIPPCFNDAYEGVNQNNIVNHAYFVEAPYFRESALWVCQQERQQGDWFKLWVDHDMTIAIRFNALSDGQLSLSALNDRFDYAESVTVNQNVQCINIKAGSNPQMVYFNISAATLFADGDERVDYLLQLGQTDLGIQSRGLCDLFNQGLYLNQTWPTLQLP